jgi:hypothetical protein
MERKRVNKNQTDITGYRKHLGLVSPVYFENMATLFETVAHSATGIRSFPWKIDNPL